MHAQIFSRGLDQADHLRMQWSGAANSSDECTQSQKPVLDHDDKERGGQRVIIVCTMIDYSLIFRHFTFIPLQVDLKNVETGNYHGFLYKEEKNYFSTFKSLAFSSVKVG